MEARCHEVEVDDINSGGAVWGGIYGHEPGFRVNGQLYKWKYISYDYKLDPTEAVKVMTRLIYQDNCKFIHGFVAPSIWASREMLEENRIFVTEHGMGEDIIGPEYPRTFRDLQMPDVVAACCVPWCADQGYQTACMLSEDSDDANQYVIAYTEELDKAGIPLLSLELSEITEVNYIPQLTAIKSIDPDIVFVRVAAGGQMGLVAKQAREVGLRGQLFMVAPYIDKELFQAVAGEEEALEGLLSTFNIGEPLTELQKAHRDEYVAKFGEEDWAYVEELFADIIYPMTVAIEKADSLDPDEVARVMPTLESPEWHAFTGDPCWWGGATRWGVDNDIVSPVYILEIRGGTTRTVDVIVPERGAY
jgi:branched-chain amino acid transport system substrate-binding protein